MNGISGFCDSMGYAPVVINRLHIVKTADDQIMGSLKANTLYGGDYQTICVICDIDLLLFINVGDQ